MLYEMDATSQLMQHILIPKLLNRWIVSVFQNTMSVVV